VSYFELKHLPLSYFSALSALVIALTFFVSLRMYYHDSYDRFHAKAENVREAIGKKVGNLEQLSKNLNQYIAERADDSVSLTAKANELLLENPEIEYIAYAQRVELADRDRFEASMRDLIHPNYTVIEQGLSGFQAARIREQYFAIRDFAPFNEQGEQILGLDIYTNAVYRNSILISLQRGHQVVVPPLPMLPDADQGFMIIDLTRIPEPGTTIKTEPWLGVHGVLLLKIDFHRVLAEINIPEGWELNYLNNGRQEKSSFFFPSHLSYQFSPELSNYPNRVNVRLRAAFNFSDFSGYSLALTVLASILLVLLSLIVMTFILGRNGYLLENNRKVQELVDAKTNELEKEKSLLQAEIEERLRLEKQSLYFGRILDQTSNEIYIFSVDNLNFIKVNQGALRNLGYTMEEMRHMTPYDLKPDIDREAFEKMVEPLLAGRQNRLVFETRHQRKDGSCYPVDVRLQLVQGDTALFVAVIEDISERQITLDKMRNLSRALEVSQDIVFITDKNGVIEYVNPAFEFSTGFLAPDAIGRRPNMLNSFKQDAGFYHKLWSTISSGIQFYGVIINRKKSGELYYEEKTITPICNNLGEICNYVSTGRDITEREMARQQMQEKNKQLEMEIIERETVQAELRKHRAHLSELVDQRTLELAKARDEAIEANSAKTRFLMNMSHELRTPLNAIIGYSELLKEDLQENGLDSYIKDVDKISLSGNHLLGLINDLMDLSRVEVGKLELESSEFSLMDLMKSVEYAVQPLMTKNNNHLFFKHDFAHHEMIGDIKRIRQVLVNLVANAGKFTQNGEVTLASRVFESDEADWIEFKVTDTGIGIEPSKIQNLFQEFSQADEQIGLKYGGTGLGLAISKKLCESMGGCITVTSNPGQGSIFVVTIPYKTSNSRDNVITTLAGGI